MALSKKQRKDRLKFGEQTLIAKELGVADSLVSAVMNGKHQLYSREKVQAVREAIAARIGESVEDVWGTAA